MNEVQITLYADQDRQSVIDGISDLQEVERALANTRRPGPEIADPYFEQLKKEVAEKSGAIFVAHIKQKVVGFVACFVEHDDNVAETPESTTFGYISDAWVSEEFRGQGIFKSLNAKAEEYLLQQNMVLARITVLAKNEPALRAYERTGYESEEISLVKKLKK